eukprot:2952977-Amphidinium_carterae.1
MDGFVRPHSANVATASSTAGKTDTPEGGRLNADACQALSSCRAELLFCQLGTEFFCHLRMRCHI